ncbi:hypothetical protein F3Y22_tig00112857pilonHSYRG00153 [Hibiscus syriacus]|uniref:Low-temperature-induced 65 kDa protein n=1 Tax=Hibiscus syriacus TaxID=106335 RepID=A0A6A2WSA5_HIBSY|nr:hypothetical protein F3Y22_tig00112857pilonHSYRG00153 [Hibiscus syriacus]
METQSALDSNIRHQHGEGGDDQHQEKHSVFTKVKARAKKMKDSIKNYSPGHHHDQGHDEYREEQIPNDHDLDEEGDDGEEEIVQNPEVHGAPLNESAAAKNVFSGQPADLSRPGITNVETSKPLPTDPLASRERSENSHTGNYETKHSDPPNSAVSGLEAPLVGEQARVDFGKTTDTVEEPLSSMYKSAAAKNVVAEQPESGGITNLETSKAFPTEPLASRESSENYNTGEGGEATGIAPIHHSMDKMKICDEHDTGREQHLPSATQPKSSESPFPTGTHDQFSPEPARPLRTVPTPTSIHITLSNHKAVPAKNIVASKLGYGEKVQAQSQSLNESSEGQNTTKQESAMDYGKTDKPSPVYEEAAGAGTTVMSKVHGPGSGTATEVETEQGQNTTKQESAMDYGKADKPSPVYEEAAGAGTTVMSKVHGPGSGTATEVETEQVQNQDKGTSVKGYIAEKFKPGDEDRALSELISEALQKRNKDSPEAEKETRARVKVTESEEVATPEKTGAESMNSPTQSVVDKLKGAVGSWFGKGEGPQITQQTQSLDTTGSSASADGRTLQESDN